MTRCRLCGRDTVEQLIEFGQHPIAHRLLSSPDEDEYKRALTLGVCDSCGLAQLIDPIPAAHLYTQYNWLSSWKPTPHVPEILRLIAELPGLGPESRVLEIGSNDGSFLAQLSELGLTNVLGLEPAEDASEAARARGVKTMQAYFTPEAAPEIIESFGHPDLLIARHVLEHVTDLPRFAEALRAVLKPGAHVLVEVPDFDFCLSARDYGALWEEHVNYFTRATLTAFLARSDVRIDSCESFLFSGRVLAAFGRSAPDEVTSTPEAEGSGPTDQARAFRDDWPEFQAKLHEYLASQTRAGKRIAVYGAGCKAATLINICNLGGHLELVVDDQAEKQGKFMPGSRLPIVASAVLDNGAADINLCLLAVNAENEDKLVERHPAYLERSGQFASIHPPSPRLPDFWRQM